MNKIMKGEDPVDTWKTPWKLRADQDIITLEE